LLDFGLISHNYPCRVYSRITLASLEEWTSVLHLASKWTFHTLRTQAIERLSTLATPVDKVILGRKYRVNGWLTEAYAMLCTRPESLSLDEGDRMTMEDVIKISEARQAIRSSAITAVADEIHSIVERLLDVPQPHEDRVEGVAPLAPSPASAIDELAEPADTVTMTEEEGGSHHGLPEEPADMERISRLITSLVEKESHITKAALLSLISRYCERSATMDSVIELIAKTAAKSPANSLVNLCSSLSGMITPSKANAHRNAIERDEIVDAKWLSDRFMHHLSLLVDHWTNIGTQSQDLNTISNVIVFLSGLIGIGTIPDDAFTQCWERIVHVSQQPPDQWGASLYDFFQFGIISKTIQTPTHSLLVDDFFHRVQMCSTEVQQWSGQWWPGITDYYGYDIANPDPNAVASYYLVVCVLHSPHKFLSNIIFPADNGIQALVVVTSEYLDMK
jgi:hypothetical protein